MTNTTDNKNTHNGHAFVDLGLPSGLLWATCNVGASSPEKTGLYFAWGETTGYTAEQVKDKERLFSKRTYKAKKICTDLSLEQDAAHAYMGGKWRMPTKVEIDELTNPNYTTSTWTTDYNGTGVAGRVITSNNNGNSIFLPASGYCDGSSVIDTGLCGDYWLSSWISELYTWYLGFFSGYFYIERICRYYGFSVRGVCEK